MQPFLQILRVFRYKHALFFDRLCNIMPKDKVLIIELVFLKLLFLFREIGSLMPTRFLMIPYIVFTHICYGKILKILMLVKNFPQRNVKYL